MATNTQWSRYPAFIIRWLKWEFWPVWLMYVPVFFYYWYLAFKARHLCFFTAANPNMEAGGLFGCSKYKQINYLPESLKPKTLLIQVDFGAAQVYHQMRKEAIHFPIIGKPDRAERGIGVALIHNEAQLYSYANAMKTQDWLLQEYISYPLEVGVFYCKRPKANKGRVCSVVIKDFLSVIGDGQKILKELIMSNYRAKVVAERLYTAHQDKWNTVLAKGEKMLLEPIGNHNRGTAFMSGGHLLGTKLDEVFENIAKNIPQFYYGRFDLRCTSVEDLLEGKNIKILEVNGVNSEPAHIYDPQASLWEGIRTLLKHWKWVCEIALNNHQLGIAYTPIRELKPVYDLWKKAARNS